MERAIATFRSNPVITTLFDVEVTLGRLIFVIGLVLMACAASVFAVLFRHTKAKARRLSSEEVGRLIVYGRASDIDVDPRPQVATVGAQGAAAELSFTIGSLRAAAERKDWLMFWGGPAMMVLWVCGGWLFFVAMCCAFALDTFILVTVTVVAILMLAIFVFMPWAAIYTDIEKDLPEDRADRTAARGPR